MEFYIFVTQFCNLNCKYCSGSSFIRNFRMIQSAPDVRQTAHFIINNLDERKNNVVFYGGEPLLNQEWIKSFMALTKNQNLTFTLQTNGTLLDKTDNYILNNLDFIYISIDGNQEVTDKLRGDGVYDKILINLRKIELNFKGAILARLTITPENSVFDSVTWLAGLRLFDYFHWQLENSLQPRNYLKATKYYQAEVSKLVDFWMQNLKSGKIIKIIPFQAIMLSLLNKEQRTSYRCGAGTFLVSIDAKGDCYSCDQLLEAPFKIGTITSKIQQKKLLSNNRSSFCSKCDIYNICGGRCFEVSLKIPTEKFHFYCDLTKILLTELRGRLAEIQALIQGGKIEIKDLEYACFTEEIP